ncbi:MAG: CHAD domain-containing protein [Rhizomicrobium sp.]
MDRQIELKLGEQEDVHHPRLFGTRTNTPVLIEARAHRDVKPRPVKATPPVLARDISAEDAFRLTLLQCKWQIASNVAAVVLARDAEGIHQMRIGFRRLRVAFTAFGGDFRNPQTERLKERAEKLAAKLGPARDLDVFIGELLEPAAQANGKLEGFEALRRRANDARRLAWDFAVAHVTSASFETFLDDLTHAIEQAIWLEPAERGSGAHRHMVFEIPAAEVANRVLEHRFDQAKKRAKHLKTMSAKKRHKLRIALKKLRYTADFFAPLYGEEAPKNFRKSLSKMQDVLGSLNDVAVARDTLEKLAHGEDDALSFAAGMIYGWHLDRAGHVWKGAKKRWKKLAQCQPFWN